MIIYLIEHRSSGKRYVGQTRRTLPQRLYEHCYHAKCGSRYPVHCAIEKYGIDAFDVKVIETIDDISVLDDAERRWIKVLNAKVDCGGYNLTDGGGGVVGHVGWHHTQEAKDAIGRGNSGIVRSDEVRAKISTSVKNAMTTEVKKTIATRTKAVLSLPETRARMQRNVWGKTSKRVEQLTLDGRLLKTFSSAREASRETGVNHGNLCACCRGNTYQAGGFSWRYTGSG